METVRVGWHEWNITETQHEDCEGCMDQAKAAAVHAAATGSIGATYGIIPGESYRMDHSRPYHTEHYAVVKRGRQLSFEEVDG